MFVLIAGLSLNQAVTRPPSRSDIGVVYSFTLLFLLIPAVSINTYFPCSFSRLVSIASLVVPAISLTIALFSPKSLFIKDDFPTFGFPIIATFIVVSSSSPSSFSGKSL